MCAIKKYLNTYLIIISIIFLSACSGNWQTYPDSAITDSVVDKETIIETDDILTVTIFEEPNISGDYTVSPDGSIQIPLAGKISVGGISLDDASNIIAADLSKDGYLVSPRVTVSISQESKTVRVMGEVLNNGEFTYKDGMTVLAAIANAGGFSYRARQDDFDIIRKVESGETLIKGNISTPLRPGDIIRVRERFF
jgi:polysaccharide export outer membrane protein